MPPLQSDLLFHAGGECWERYGVSTRRLAPISHGGEELKETFTRADGSTVASIIDRDGFIRRALANTLRVSYELIDGVRKACTLHEASRTNLVTWSDALSNWTSVGTPTVQDAAVTNGGLDLTLVGDDDGAAREDKTLAVTFTGDGVKSMMVALKAGTSLAADGSKIRIEDSAVGADRLQFDVTWSGGVPTITMVDGTQLGTAELLRDGVYLVRFQTSTVTAVNSHLIRVSPAKTAAQTGNLYIGGVQAENATFPSSLIKTTGSTLTRAADRLEFPFNHQPQVMTIYAHFIERAQPNWVTVGGGPPRIFQIGASADSSPLLLLLKSGALDAYEPRHITALGDVGAAQRHDINPVFGDEIELRMLLNPNGSVQLHGAKNGGAESSGAVSAALAFASAWSSPTLVSVGCIGAAGQGDIALRSLKVVRGVHDLQSMRDL